MTGAGKFFEPSEITSLQPIDNITLFILLRHRFYSSLSFILSLSLSSSLYLYRYLSVSLSISLCISATLFLSYSFYLCLRPSILLIPEKELFFRKLDLSYNFLYYKLVRTADLVVYAFAVRADARISSIGTRALSARLVWNDSRPSLHSFFKLFSQPMMIIRLKKTQ